MEGYLGGETHRGGPRRSMAHRSGAIYPERDGETPEADALV